LQLVNLFEGENSQNLEEVVEEEEEYKFARRRDHTLFQIMSEIFYIGLRDKL
jgi:hypothetical protein